MTTDGFFSAVEDRSNPKQLCIRARVKADLQALGTKIDIGPIIENVGSDYPCRVFVPKTLWANYLQKAAGDIDYDNFKDEIHRVQGGNRARVYLNVWGDLRDLQTASYPKRRNR